MMMMTSREKEKRKSSSSSKTPIIAGAVAGVVSRFCIAPLDVVKIRLQLQPRLLSQSTTPIPTTGTIYNGIYDTMRTIVREEGVTALWKGNIPAELLYLTYGAAQFFFYAQTQSFLSSSPLTSHLPTTMINTCSGGIAGGIATSITYPFDLLRTRFAASKGTTTSTTTSSSSNNSNTGGSSVGNKRVYSSLRSAITGIYKDEGIKGFYRGGAAAVIQIVPHMGLFFGSYEGIKAGLLRLPSPITYLPPSLSSSSNTTSNNHPILQSLAGMGSVDAVSGVLGGVIAKTGVFPLDTIRKRLQVQGPTRTGYVNGDIPVYEGVVRCGREVVRREGWRGLYRGLTVSLVKAAPASAVTMWTYGRAVEVVGWFEERE
ncbi:mitochondrial thiamine pyrophosphate transporter [Orbilia oligospora]|uniref:Mitochondrial thiamine pyrophosphate carrier 1 n=1 Tax=Orbilia oligospora TaxID=2813651 RepID=A0A7C8P7Q4_ORBOL|nr:mitochondrial thiamine pyrophosphate transporter [Orbilia oligospora]TGJ66951.1 mitochondrial thiamine pyrophosphate transporter [Orbilia oligospora]